MVKTSLKQDEHMTLDSTIESCTVEALIDLGELVLIANIACLSIFQHPDIAKWFPEPKDGEEKRIIEKAKNSIPENLKNFLTIIPKWAFINFVAVFEAWMSDILRAILRKYPQKIRKRNIESSIVTESSSYEECLEKLIDIELGGIFYAGPKEATKRLQEITSIDIENIPQLADIFEFKAARDILLHNKGVVSKIYLDKAGNKARAKEGEKIKIDLSSLGAAYQTVNAFISKVNNSLLEKFK